MATEAAKYFRAQAAITGNPVHIDLAEKLEAIAAEENRKTIVASLKSKLRSAGYGYFNLLRSGDEKLAGAIVFKRDSWGSPRGRALVRLTDDITNLVAADFSVLLEDRIERQVSALHANGQITFVDTQNSGRLATFFQEYDSVFRLSAVLGEHDLLTENYADSILTEYAQRLGTPVTDMSKLAPRFKIGD